MSEPAQVLAATKSRRERELARRRAIPIQCRVVEAGVAGTLLELIELPDDVLACGRDDWLLEVTAWAKRTHHRTVSYRNVMAVARWMHHLGRTIDNTTAPGLKKHVARKAGVSNKTVTRTIRELTAAGFLVRLSEGRSADLPGTDGRALRPWFRYTVPNPESDAINTDRLFRRVNLRVVDLNRETDLTVIKIRDLLLLRRRLRNMEKEAEALRRALAQAKQTIGGYRRTTPRVTQSASSGFGVGRPANAWWHYVVLLAARIREAIRIGRTRRGDSRPPPS